MAAAQDDVLASAAASRGWLAEVERIDAAVYVAVAETPPPSLDTAMSRLSRAADKSRLWMASAAALALSGGRPGRKAAFSGLASVATTSLLINVAVKPIARRRRPDREAAAVPLARQVPMPRSTSLPSGHAASAFAFATGAGQFVPAAGVPLRALAALVAYSRVHTGVHFPGDVIAGSLIGAAAAQATARSLERLP